MPTTIQHGLRDVQLVNHICECGNLSHLKPVIFYFQDVKLGFFFFKFLLIELIITHKKLETWFLSNLKFAIFYRCEDGYYWYIWKM